MNKLIILFWVFCFQVKVATPQNTTALDSLLTSLTIYFYPKEIYTETEMIDISISGPSPVEGMTPVIMQDLVSKSMTLHPKWISSINLSENEIFQKIETVI